MRLEFMVDIHRPVRAVFRIVSDLENDPKWQTAVTGVTKLSAGPIAKGTRFRHVVRLIVRSTVLDMEFRHYVRERRYVLNCVTGPFEFATEVHSSRLPPVRAWCR